MANSEAIRRWQAESLAKRLLEEDELPTIIASAFDLNCQLEFEEAILTLANSKERAIGRACADGFADFSIQVDSALENSSRTGKARQVMVATNQVVKQSIQSHQKAAEQLKEANAKLTETRSERNEVELCLSWLKRKKEVSNLIRDKAYVKALAEQERLIEDLRQFPLSQVALKLKNELAAIDIRRTSEKELDAWMTGALDRGREIGFACLSRDRRSSQVDLATFDAQPVKRFFAVTRQDYAEERYANHRLPALKQTLSALARANTASVIEERIVRFRNALAEVCGFFTIEKAIGALRQGELKEMWLECCSRLIQALESGFPPDTEAESATNLACDFARTCAAIDMNHQPIQKFFLGKQEVIRKGWISRSVSAIRDFCHSDMNKRATAASQEDGTLPFTSKTVQEITGAVRDAEVLNQFTLGGFLSAWKDQSPWSILETFVVEKALQDILKMPNCDLSDALFVFRACRELRSYSEGPSAYFETENIAREQIQQLFVASKVDKCVVFQSPQDFMPALNSATKIEPHPCILRAINEIETAFNSPEAAAIPRELKASLLQETIGRLADRVEQNVFNDAPMLNPLSLKLFSLDVLAIDQAFPDHYERFASLLNVLVPFTTENGLENALTDLPEGDRERTVLILQRFREMDASSRLFAPPALKKSIVDMRESDARRHLTLFQDSLREDDSIL